MSEVPSPEEAARATGRRLDRSLASGLAWTAAAKWTTQILSWASTLIVARLLTPDDYGIIGMATVFLGLVQLVSEFGLGAALIQQRDLSEDRISEINGLAVLIGILLFAAASLCAPLVTAFFHEPAVRWVVVALATQFVITSFQVVPNALLARTFQFRRLAVLDSIDALVQTAATLTLAVVGLGYWAIVLGGIGARIVTSGAYLIVAGHRMAWPRQLRQLHRVLTFGWQVVGSRLTYYVYSSADFAVIGRLLGKTALGAYSFGWNIASIPADKINSVMSRVMVPVFAEIQREPAALARYLTRLSEALVYTVLPASVGLALVAPDFVRVVLGERWLAAIVPLQLLSIHVTIRCVNGLFSQALLGIGETRQALRVGIWLVVTMPVLFVLGAVWWGPPGVALAWLVGHPLVSLPLLIRYTARRVAMPLAAFGAALLPPVVGTGVMVAAVLGALALLPSGTTSVLRLTVGVGIGAAAYPAVMWLLYAPRLRDIAASLRRLRS